MENILENLLKIINEGVSNGRLKSCHSYCYCGDVNLINEIDTIRVDIVETVNKILIDANLSPLLNILLNKNVKSNISDIS